MIKKRFWEDIAEIWSQKEAIVIPDSDVDGYAPPDDPEDEAIDFDDLDDFFKDILSDDEGEL